MASGASTSKTPAQTLDTQTQGCGGNTPLHEVVKMTYCSNPEDTLTSDEKHIQCIKLLLKLNPDINVKNAGGYTPLHLAVSNLRSVSVLEALTNNSEHVFIDVNSVNLVGEAAIHKIVSYRNSEDAVKVIALLMKLKADINQRNSQGASILDRAIEYNRPEDVIKAIVDYGADLNATGEQGCTALYRAVFPTTSSYDEDSSQFNFSYRSVGIIKHLVEKGSKINTVAENGYSPLLLAVVMKKTDYVKAMLENCLELVGLEQSASSHCLQEEYHTQYMTYVGRKGRKKINWRKHTSSYPSSEYYNLTPLLISVYDCDKEMTELLLKAGASVNAVNSSGENALHMITKKNVTNKRVKFSEKQLQEQEVQIAKLLIENGIDVNAKDNLGGSALNYAIQNDKHEIVVYMLENSV